LIVFDILSTLYLTILTSFVFYFYWLLELTLHILSFHWLSNWLHFTFEFEFLSLSLSLYLSVSLSLALSLSVSLSLSLSISLPLCLSVSLCMVTIENILVFYKYRASINKKSLILNLFYFVIDFTYLLSLVIISWKHQRI